MRPAAAGMDEIRRMVRASPTLGSAVLMRCPCAGACRARECVHCRRRCAHRCRAPPPGAPAFARCSASFPLTRTVPRAAMDADALCRGHWLHPADCNPAVRAFCAWLPPMVAHDAGARSDRREAFGLFPCERNFNRFPAWLVRRQRCSLFQLPLTEPLRAGQELDADQAAPPAVRAANACATLRHMHR